MDINNNNDIHIADIINNEDGTATVSVECSPEKYNKVFNYGFVSLLMKGIEADADD